MTLRGCRDVNDVRSSRFQHLIQIGKALGNAEAFAKLSRRQQFSIAQTYNPAIRNSMNRVHVLVGDFTAADDGNA